MGFNDRTDIESVLETPTPPPTATPTLTTAQSIDSPVGAPGLAHAVEDNAVQVGAPTPQGAPLAGTPLPTPAPTLASEGPVQGTPAPRLAGKQLVPPPAPPPPAISGQLTQPANAPQHMVPISTLRQG